MSNILATISGSNANITTELACTAYTADAERTVLMQVRLSAMNGAAATVTANLAHLSAADALIGNADALSKAKKAAANTVWGCRMLGPVTLAAGEKLQVSLLSTNASDTAVAYAIKVIDAFGADLAAAVATRLAAASYTAPDNAGIAAAAASAASADGKASTILDDVEALANLSQEQAQAAAAAALAAYGAAKTSDLPAGDGLVSHTYPVTDGNGDPIEGVKVWATMENNSALAPKGNTPQVTDAAGEVTLRFDSSLAGQTVYLWRLKEGVVFEDPDVETI